VARSGPQPPTVGQGPAPGTTTAPARPPAKPTHDGHPTGALIPTPVAQPPRRDRRARLHRLRRAGPIAAGMPLASHVRVQRREAGRCGDPAARAERAVVHDAVGDRHLPLMPCRALPPHAPTRCRQHLIRGKRSVRGRMPSGRRLRVCNGQVVRVARAPTRAYRAPTALSSCGYRRWSATRALARTATRRGALTLPVSSRGRSLCCGWGATAPTCPADQTTRRLWPHRHTPLALPTHHALPETQCVNARRGRGRTRYRRPA